MGYWSNHKYERRSVTKDSEKGFLGWSWIEEQLAKYTGIKARRNRALFLTYFKTGGRACEVLNLKRGMFTVDQDYIIINDMMKEKDSENKTYQPIKIPRQEPLNKEWINYINSIKYVNDYIFPSPSKDNKPMSYDNAYRIITKTGTYPHFLRSQRSSMELRFYNISPHQLKTLRQWKTDSMVEIYAAAEVREQAQEKMLEKFKS